MQGIFEVPLTEHTVQCLLRKAPNKPKYLTFFNGKGREQNNYSFMFTIKVTVNIYQHYISIVIQGTKAINKY